MDVFKIRCPKRMSLKKYNYMGLGPLVLTICRNIESVMVSDFPKSANKPNEMALTI